ncbi:MAG: hypothetical protein ACT4PV_16355 [Planctomycetaceae bacterium]
MRRLWLLPLLVAAACGGGGRSPFVRITADDGRVYYANQDKALFSTSRKFLTFRDLVTREQVMLDEGTFVAQECPVSEVEIRQREYLDNPAHPPR